MLNNKSLMSVAETVKKVWAEGLTGKQKNIDKNHNGKVDDQDFKILRKEGWEDMKKDAKERMGSVPKPNGGSGVKQGTAYGGSKQKPDAPVKEEASQAEFTAELKKAQAKASAKAKQAEVAKPAVQAVQNEEAEQIEELSKDTLNSYVKKSFGDKEKENLDTPQRQKGLRKATSRLYKEETHTTIELIDLTGENGVKMSTIELGENEYEKKPLASFKTYNKGE